jgi:hypothetical protein
MANAFLMPGTARVELMPGLLTNRPAVAPGATADAARGGVDVECNVPEHGAGTLAVLSS